MIFTLTKFIDCQKRFKQKSLSTAVLDCLSIEILTKPKSLQAFNFLFYRIIVCNFFNKILSLIVNANQIEIFTNMCMRMMLNDINV